jgi:cbb3-type cytochrome oxidase cytochrome c subunit
MKSGEKFVLISIIGLLAFGIVRTLTHVEESHESEIPFYSTASANVASKATDIYRTYTCRSCHSLWSLKDVMQSVPAPMMDGIGSLHTEEWIYAYLSSSNPQSIIPSRLKKKYQMPSYANMPEADRRLLANYLASLKVKDWYLEQTKNEEHDKLTGEDTAK